MWPSFRKLSIKLKLTLLIASIATVISVLQIIVFSFLDAHNSFQNRRVRTDVIADVIGLNAAPALHFANKADAEEVLHALSKDPAIRSAYLFAADGSLFAQYIPEGVSEAVPEVSEQPKENFDDNMYSVVHDIRSNGQMLGKIYLKTDLSALAERRTTRILVGTLIGVLGFAVSLLLGWWLQRMFSEPIKSLSQAMTQVTREENYSLRMGRFEDRDFAMLSDGFNHMLRAIENRDLKLADQMQLLEQSNRELDSRVAQRTGELEATNKELESFSYSVSHDLRAPLRSIEGFSQVLMMDFESSLDPEAKRLLGIIISDVQKMGRLIDDLLAFSRTGRQQMAKAVIDMNLLTNQVYEQVKGSCPEREIKFVVSDLPPALGDVNMLRQVMVNLLTNAVKFTAKKEKARIEVIGITTERENVYSVRDNGVGFDSRFKNKLFGVFQRLHAEDEFQGTGIGLALVHRIIQRHGGTISAEGEIDRGAVFRFSIPLLEKGNE